MKKTEYHHNPEPKPLKAESQASQTAAASGVDGHASGAALPQKHHGQCARRCRKRKRKPSQKANPVLRSASYTHSLVTTAIYRLVNGPEAHVNAAWQLHQAVMPPRQVHSTDAQSIGKGILVSLEEYVFGQPFESFIRQLQQCKFAVIMFVCDAASANRLLLRKLRAFIISILVIAGVGAQTVCVWVELCGAHRAARIGAKVVKMIRLAKPLQTFSRILPHRKIRRQMRRNAFAWLDATFEHNALPPPVVEGADAASETLRTMLLTDFKPQAATQSRFARCYDFFFYKRSPFIGGVLGHTCSLFTCGGCRNRTEALVKAKQEIDDMFFSAVAPKFNLSRWCRWLPFCIHASHWIILGCLLQYAIAGLKAGDDPNSMFVQQLGARIATLTKAVADTSLKSKMMLMLVVSTWIEDILKCHMLDATQIDPLDSNAAPGNIDNRKSPVRRSVEAVRALQECLWAKVLDQSSASEFRICELLWPADRPKHEFQMLIQSVVLNVLSDLSVRFPHGTAPYTLCQHEDKSPQHLVWAAQAAEIGDMKSCDCCEMVFAWQGMLSPLPAAAKGPMLCSLYHVWAKSCRAASLQEEGWHQFQRDWVVGGARQFHRQAAENCCEGIRRIWDGHGGRDITKPLPEMAATRKRHMVAGDFQPTKYRRKHQEVPMNQASFKWVAEQVAGIGGPHGERVDTIREYGHKWKALSLAERQRREPLGPLLVNTVSLLVFPLGMIF